MSRSIVLFETDLFQRPEAKDEAELAELERYPWGRDAAEFLMKRMEAKGAPPCLDEPTAGDAGYWEWDVRLGEDVFIVNIQSFPLGPPREDYWLVQTDKRIGIWAALFGRKTPEEDLKPVCDLLRSILEGEPEIRNVRWLTREEFGAVDASGHWPPELD